MKKKHLAITLSKLIPHPHLNVNLEQYATEGDVASNWIFAIAEKFEFIDSNILDLGSGNGILGIAAYYAGASRITLVETDTNAHEVAQSNVDNLEFNNRFTLLNSKISDIEIDWKGIDLVISNPPWGYQMEKADREFIEIGMRNNVAEIHILHSSKATHLEKIGKEYGYDTEVILQGSFRLPAIYSHHTKSSEFTEFSAWRFFKQP